MKERGTEQQHEASRVQGTPTGLEERDTNIASVFQSPRELLPGLKPDFEGIVFSPDRETHYTLDELGEMEGYNTDYLRQLAAQGRLKATKIGQGSRGIWIATKKALQEYQEGGNNERGRPRRPNRGTH